MAGRVEQGVIAGQQMPVLLDNERKALVDLCLGRLLSANGSPLIGRHLREGRAMLTLRYVALRRRAANCEKHENDLEIHEGKSHESGEKSWLNGLKSPRLMILMKSVRVVVWH